MYDFFSWVFINPLIILTSWVRASKTMTLQIRHSNKGIDNLIQVNCIASTLSNPTQRYQTLDYNQLTKCGSVTWRNTQALPPVMSVHTIVHECCHLNFRFRTNCDYFFIIFLVSTVIPLLGALSIRNTLLKCHYWFIIKCLIMHDIGFILIR